jgi:hypothetical protein
LGTDLVAGLDEGWLRGGQLGRHGGWTFFLLILLGRRLGAAGQRQSTGERHGRGGGAGSGVVGGGRRFFIVSGLLVGLMRSRGSRFDRRVASLVRRGDSRAARKMTHSGVECDRRQ